MNPTAFARALRWVSGKSPITTWEVPRVRSTDQIVCRKRVLVKWLSAPEGCSAGAEAVPPSHPGQFPRRARRGVDSARPCPRGSGYPLALARAPGGAAVLGDVSREQRDRRLCRTNAAAWATERQAPAEMWHPTPRSRLRKPGTNIAELRRILLFRTSAAGDTFCTSDCPVRKQSVCEPI